jgi:hypothetical protein
MRFTMKPTRQIKQVSVQRRDEISSLEAVRTSLAEDVIQFLAIQTTTRDSSDSSTSRSGPPEPSSETRQILLRDAVVDLQSMDDRLRHARP